MAMVMEMAMVNGDGGCGMGMERSERKLMEDSRGWHHNNISLCSQYPTCSVFFYSKPTPRYEEVGLEVGIRSVEV